MEITNKMQVIILCRSFHREMLDVYAGPALVKRRIHRFKIASHEQPARIKTQIILFVCTVLHFKRSLESSQKISDRKLFSLQCLARSD